MCQVCTSLCLSVWVFVCKLLLGEELDVCGRGSTGECQLDTIIISMCLTLRMLNTRKYFLRGKMLLKLHLKVLYGRVLFVMRLILFR